MNDSQDRGLRKPRSYSLYERTHQEMDDRATDLNISTTEAVQQACDLWLACSKNRVLLARVQDLLEKGGEAALI